MMRFWIKCGHRISNNYIGCFLALLVCAANVQPAPAQPVGSAVRTSSLAIKGDVIYTMAGPPIKNGVLLLSDGKIDRVGPAEAVAIPNGVQTLTAAVVTPGLIDAHTVVGFTGYLNQDQDQDQIDRSEPLQPELRAIDGYNAQERLVEWVRNFGVTTLHTGHAPGAVISGQTMVVKTVGNSVEDAVLVPTAMIAATLGPSAKARGGKDAKGKSPGTRAKIVAMLRAEFIKAQAYLRKRASADVEKKPDRNLRLEALGRVLKGELPLMVTAHRAQDILAALRVAEEFKIPLVLDGAAEAYLVIDQIKAAGAWVIVHPTMARSHGERENLSMETAAVLHKAGIPIALQSGYESYVPKTRVVLFEAAVAAANGLSFEEALATITIDAARLLRVDDRVGSLEPGKDADVALYDGDPFEYTSHCTAVIINGRIVSDQPH